MLSLHQHIICLAVKWHVVFKEKIKTVIKDNRRGNHTHKTKAMMQFCLETKWHVPATCCTLCFSVDVWWRALTCRFLPAPINYLAVPVPPRGIISEPDRTNNEPWVHCLSEAPHWRAPCTKKRIELCLLSYGYHELNAFWEGNQWFVKKLLKHNCQLRKKWYYMDLLNTGDTTDLSEDPKPAFKENIT